MQRLIKLLKILKRKISVFFINTNYLAVSDLSKKSYKEFLLIYHGFYIFNDFMKKKYKDYGLYNTKIYV